MKSCNSENASKFAICSVGFAIVIHPVFMPFGMAFDIATVAFGVAVEPKHKTNRKYCKQDGKDDKQVQRKQNI